MSQHSTTQHNTTQHNTTQQYILFGSGYYGKAAVMTLGKEMVRNFVDNDSGKWGTDVWGIKVISPEEFKELPYNYRCMVCLARPAADAVSRQLKGYGIEHEFFDTEEFEKRPRLISYSHFFNMEDVVLYDVLKDEKDLFYIDVGCNDPFMDSVTKLLYDMKQAHGINVDVLEEMIELTKNERPYDKGICVGVGEREEEKEFFVQGGLSSFLDEYAQSYGKRRKINIVTFESICNKHLRERDGLPIHFLKIDCEGFEDAVIRSANWQKYRPWIVLVESTEPCTIIPSWEKWENYLLSQGYHFVMMAGVNRYYVADEHKELDDRFLTLDELIVKYRVYHAELRRVTKLADPF